MRELWMLAVICLSIALMANFAALTPTSAVTVNVPPRWDFATTDFSVDGELRLKLNDVFFDADGDVLSFSVSPVEGVSAGISGDELIVVGAQGKSGRVVVSASDGKVVSSQEIVVLIR